MSPTPPLLTVRAALVLLIALVIGLLAAGLAYLDHHSAPAALLMGGGASGASLLIFHSVIGRT